MKIQNALVWNIFDRSQRYFVHVTTVTLSWRVQNIVVTGSVYFTLECFEFSSNFEFDRNIVSGTGAWYELDVRNNISQQMLKCQKLIISVSRNLMSHVCRCVDFDIHCHIRCYYPPFLICVYEYMCVYMYCLVIYTHMPCYHQVVCSVYECMSICMYMFFVDIPCHTLLFIIIISLCVCVWIYGRKRKSICFRVINKAAFRTYDFSVVCSVLLSWGTSFELRLVRVMMTSSNGNIFRVTGPLCGEFTGHR